MTVTEKIIETLKVLPPDKQEEVLDFAEFLVSRCARVAPKQNSEKAKRHLTIDYPESLPDILQESVAQFEQEARMAMVVKLFEMKRISSGIAAEMAGMERITFLLKLHEYGVSAVNMDEEELLSDITSA